MTFPMRCLDIAPTEYIYLLYLALLMVHIRKTAKLILNRRHQVLKIVGRLRGRKQSSIKLAVHSSIFNVYSVQLTPNQIKRSEVMAVASNAVTAQNDFPMGCF